jgi:outer membrane protein assembly factor BamB
MYCRIVLPLIFLSQANPALLGLDQPQWGERFSRNMVSSERNLPAAFDITNGLNLKWKVALGTATYSTPVISGGKVLIGTNNERPRDPRNKGDRGVVMCFDEKDGRFLWQLAVPKITNSMFWDWPRAGTCSPATIEGNRVYLVSNRGEVLCLDLEGMSNGNDGPFTNEASHCVPQGADPIPAESADADILWAFDMIKECGVRQHDSAHSSILLDGDFLYVNTSNGVDDSHKRIMSPDAPSLIVLDKHTGRLVARDDEHIGPYIFHSTWSSPALGVVNARRLVFFAGGNGKVYAFEALSKSPPAGTVMKLKKSWEFDCDPTAPKENVHKYNSNHSESPSNIKSMPVFFDNRVYVTGGGDVWWGKNQAWLKCIDATKTGTGIASAAVWEYPLGRHVMSSPALAEGLVFVGDFERKLHCVDAVTGQRCWTHELAGEMWSSCLLADGRVYAVSQRGDFWIFALSREKKILHQTKLDSFVASTPVAANGTLYVTTMKWLYAIAVK